MHETILTTSTLKRLPAPTSDPSLALARAASYSPLTSTHLQVGAHAQAFDLTLQPGNFVFSLDVPLGFTSATDLVLVPVCAVPGASALASVDSLDIRAIIDPARVLDH